MSINKLSRYVEAQKKITTLSIEILIQFIKFHVKTNAVLCDK